MKLITGLAAALLTACAVQPQTAGLYPANDAAAASGVARAVFTPNGTGHGAIALTMPDGEVIQGEYSIVRGGVVGFGTIYGSVYGATSTASYSGGTTSYSMPGASQGVASGVGERATRMDCEFINDNVSGHGNGACRSSRGGLYRLIY